jgi:hypothetical protein
MCVIEPFKITSVHKYCFRIVVSDTFLSLYYSAVLFCRSQ